MRAITTLLLLALLPACGTEDDKGDTDDTTETDDGTDTETDDDGTDTETDDDGTDTDGDDTDGTDTDGTDTDGGDTDGTDTDGGDTDDTDDTDVFVQRDPPEAGWWLMRSTQTTPTDTCGLPTTPFPSFELAFDGTNWTASSQPLNAEGLVVDYPAIDFACTYVDSVSLTCTGATTLNGYPGTMTLSTTD